VQRGYDGMRTPAGDNTALRFWRDGSHIYRFGQWDYVRPEPWLPALALPAYTW